MVDYTSVIKAKWWVRQTTDIDRLIKWGTVKWPPRWRILPKSMGLEKWIWLIASPTSIWTWVVPSLVLLHNSKRCKLVDPVMKRWTQADPWSSVASQTRLLVSESPYHKTSRLCLRKWHQRLSSDPHMHACMHPHIHARAYTHRHTHF